MKYNYKLLFFKILLVFNIGFIQSQTYISPLGNNTSGDGSLSNPYQTLTHVIDNTSATNIKLLEGVYHEEIIISKSGLTITAESGHNVVLNGSKTLSNPWVYDAPLNGGYLYKTTVDTDTWQLFINDHEQVMARWPNASFDREDPNTNWIYDHNKWAMSDKSSAYKGGKVKNKVDNSHGYSIPSSVSAIDFNQAHSSGNPVMIVANFGSFRTYTGKIKTFNGSDEFTFDASINGEKTKHKYYFIERHKKLLDTNNEWFFEDSDLNDINSGGTIYVWRPNNNAATLDALNNATVRAKTQTYALDVQLSGGSIIIDGLNFFATTIRLDNNNGSIIKNCKFQFPSCSKRMLGVTDAPLTTSIDQKDNGDLPSSGSSSNCEFINNILAYTDGEAFLSAGNNHTVSHNYFHHIDWSCGSTQSIGLSIFNTGNDYTFEYNTLHTTGASATTKFGKRQTVRFNDISDTGYAQSDGSIIQITNADVQGSEVAYNWLHDTDKYGFRFDAPSGAACGAGEYGITHHNVIWNIGDDSDLTGGIGMMIKGEYQQVYNNTVFNCLKADILIVDEPCVDSDEASQRTNEYTYTRNNLTDFITGHRTKTYNGIAVNNPATLPSQNNDGSWNWQAAWENRKIPPTYIAGRADRYSNNFTLNTGNNGEWFSGSFSDTNDDTTASILTTKVANQFINGDSGITYDYNNVLANRNNYNFIPSNNIADIKDKGYAITNEFNGPNEAANLSDNQLREASENPLINGILDIGAYEVNGINWKAGVDLNPNNAVFNWPGTTSNNCAGLGLTQNGGGNNPGIRWALDNTCSNTFAGTLWAAANSNTHDITIDNGTESGHLRLSFNVAHDGSTNTRGLQQATTVSTFNANPDDILEITNNPNNDFTVEWIEHNWNKSNCSWSGNRRIDALIKYNGNQWDQELDLVLTFNKNDLLKSNVSEINYCAQTVNIKYTPKILDTDGDTIANSVDTDDDNDGVNDSDEIAIGTNPLLVDSNNNGLTDGDEDFDNDGISNADESDASRSSITDTNTNAIADVAEALDTDGDNIADILDTDDDNDGVNDSDEIAIGTNPLLTDTNNNGVNDGDEDFDNDGLSNANESDASLSSITDTDSNSIADILEKVSCIGLAQPSQSNTKAVRWALDNSCNNTFSGTLWGIEQSGDYNITIPSNTESQLIRLSFIVSHDGTTQQRGLDKTNTEAIFNNNPEDIVALTQNPNDDFEVLWIEHNWNKLNCNWNWNRRIDALIQYNGTDWGIVQDLEVTFNRADLLYTDTTQLTYCPQTINVSYIPENPCKLVVEENLITKACDASSNNGYTYSVSIPFSNQNNNTIDIISNFGNVTGDDPQLVNNGEIVINNIPLEQTLNVSFSGVCNYNLSSIDPPNCTYFNEVVSNKTKDNGNWSHGVPDDSTNAIITTGANCIITQNLTANALIIETDADVTLRSKYLVKINTLHNNGTFLLRSNDSHHSDLIVTEESIGTVSYKKTVNGWGEMDMISTPLADQTFGNFVLNNNNKIYNTPGNTNYLFDAFNPLTNTYESLSQVTHQNTELALGKGFKTATKNENSSSSFLFSGSVLTNDLSLNIQPNATNLIGNPYTTSVSSKAFISENLNVFAQGHEGIYVYNGLDTWEFHDINSERTIEVGEAFRVITGSNTNAIQFKTAMFNHIINSSRPSEDSKLNTINNTIPKLILSVSKKVLNVKGKLSSMDKLEILDLKGTLVHKKTIGNQLENLNIDMTSYTAGIYILTINKNSKKMIQKFIIR